MLFGLVYEKRKMEEHDTAQPENCSVSKKKEPSKNEGEKDPKKPPRPKVLPLPRNEWFIPKGYSAKNNKVGTHPDPSLVDTGCAHSQL